jgi:hypothetical protein
MKLSNLIGKENHDNFLGNSLGTATIRLGYSVRYFRTSHLLHALKQARQEASYPNVLRSPDPHRPSNTGRLVAG